MPSSSASPQADASVVPVATWAPIEVGGYVRAWEARVGGASRALAFAPNGDVLAAGSEEVVLLSRQDGSVVRRVALASPALDGDCVFMASAEVATVVLVDGVYELPLADFALRKRVDFPMRQAAQARPSLCARSRTRIAVADDDGRVEERSRGDYRQLRASIGSAKGIRALAYDDSREQLALSWQNPPVTVLAGAPLAPVPGFTGSSGALAFSWDGRRLFGELDEGRAGDVSLFDHGSARGNVPIGSSLRSARYLDADRVVATGSDGLSVISMVPLRRVVLDPDGTRGLAVSADVSVVCAGGETGRIACHERLKR
jgi:hypothetical protein